MTSRGPIDSFNWINTIKKKQFFLNLWVRTLGGLRQQKTPIFSFTELIKKKPKIKYSKLETVLAHSDEIDKKKTFFSNSIEFLKNE